MGNLLFAIYRPDLVKRLDGGGQTTMDTENLPQEREIGALEKLHIQGCR